MFQSINTSKDMLHNV